MEDTFCWKTLAYMHVDEVVLVFKDRAPWAIFVILPWCLLLMILLLLFSRWCMFFLVFLDFLIRSFNRGSVYVRVYHFFLFSTNFGRWTILFLLFWSLVKPVKLILKAVCTDEKRSLIGSLLNLLSSTTRKFGHRKELSIVFTVYGTWCKWTRTNNSSRFPTLPRRLPLRVPRFLASLTLGRNVGELPWQSKILHLMDT